jgi:hypothetical protein
MRVTISGAIQYGALTFASRDACVWSDLYAQNPKSAGYRQRAPNQLKIVTARTQLDVARETEEHIVALDVAVDAPMAVEVLQPLRRRARYRRDLALGHRFAVTTSVSDRPPCTPSRPTERSCADLVDD